MGMWIAKSEAVNGRVLCDCSCGRTRKYVALGEIKNGRSTHCLKCRPQNHDRTRLFYLSNALYSKLLSCVNNALRRCCDVNDNRYPWYGARGIKVHESWREDKVEFIQYLLTLDGHDDFSLVLDRKNNDGDYEPGNLQFVTYSESNTNQRRSERDRDDEGKFC